MAIGSISLEERIQGAVLNPDVRESLYSIVNYEIDNEERRKEIGVSMFWDYGDVSVDPMTLHKLFKLKIIKMPFGAGGKRKTYVLMDLNITKKILNGEDVKLCKENTIEAITNTLRIPDFDIVVGYHDLKELLKRSLESDQPVHICLVGPPASAKSLFLMELEELPNSAFALGGSATKVGIRDLLIDQKPKYLLLDEIDKIDSTSDLSSLLSWMESGRVSVLKHGVNIDIKGEKGWVFAACNTDKKMPPELKSRFMMFYLKPYTLKEFNEVTVKVLIQKENKTEEVATYIAEKLSKTTRDVRDAIKIARLSKNIKDVDFILKTMTTYCKR